MAHHKHSERAEQMRAKAQEAATEEVQKHLAAGNPVWVKRDGRWVWFTGVAEG